MPVRARRAAAVIALPTVIITGVGVAAAAGPADSSARPAAAVPAYAGSAYGLKAQIGLSGSKLIDQILPVIVTFPSGGDESLLELPSELSEAATLKVLNASSIVKDGVLRSNAKTAGLAVVRTLVTASVLNADCTADGEKVSGDAQVADLAIAGIKVPVDPGPNFKIAIPDALGFLSGGIIVDRQDTLKSGALRVRALDVRLVADLAGLNKALESLVAEVRAAAQKVAAAIEEATGQTIEVLAARQRLVRSALPALPGGVTDGAGTQRAGAASERNAVRAEYAAKQARESARESAERDAALLEREARAKEAAYAAAQRGATDARAQAARADAASTDVADTEAADTATQAAPAASKADRADVGRETEAEAQWRGHRRSQAPASDDTQDSATKTDATKMDGAEAQAAEDRAASRAAAEPATPDAVEPVAVESDPAAAQAAAERAEAEAQRAGVQAADARKAADKARVRADAAAGRGPSAKAAPAKKVDRGDVGPAEAGTVQTGQTAVAQAGAAKSGTAPAGTPAAPIADDPEEDPDLGLVGVNVVVSQVICKGAKVLGVRTVPEKPAPAPVPDEDKGALPRTGGNGNGSAGLGAIGLGLLAAGTAAVFITRRRRHAC